jgi:hypothetical protein
MDWIVSFQTKEMTFNDERERETIGESVRAKSVFWAHFEKDWASITYILFMGCDPSDENQLRTHLFSHDRADLGQRAKGKTCAQGSNRGMS